MYVSALCKGVCVCEVHGAYAFLSDTCVCLCVSDRTSMSQSCAVCFSLFPPVVFPPVVFCPDFLPRCVFFFESIRDFLNVVHSSCCLRLLPFSQ